MLQNYLKIAFRNLVRHKVYSFINIGGLAVGLAACLLIALYVQDERSHDRFHANFNHIYRVVSTQKQLDGLHEVAVTAGPLAPTLQKDFAEIVRTLRVGRWGALLQLNGKNIEPTSVLVVDNTFFQMFDFKLLLGNPKTALSRPDELVISEKLAEQFFGKNWRKSAILGQIITLNGQSPAQIVGVVTNAPANSHLQFDALLPFKSLEKYDEWSMKWNSNSYHTYLQLRPQANVAAFEQKIAGLMAKYDNGPDTRLHLQPLASIYLDSQPLADTDWGKRSDRFYVRVFVSVGLIVLLIALFNFVNLATARASTRAREVGVRKSIGAHQRGLVGQFLGESVLLAVLAVTVGLLLAKIALPWFNQLANRQLNIPYVQINFWLGVVSTTLLIGLLAGTYPAFFLSSFRTVNALKGITVQPRGLSFRKALVVVQFGLSVVLIISTLVIYRQLRFVQSKNLGFDQSQLMYLRLKGDSKGKAEVFKNELVKLVGVSSVTANTNNLVDVANSSYLEWEGQTPDTEFLITQMNTDPQFLATTGIKLVAGRNFATSTDTSDQIGRYLVNETAAKRMGCTNQTVLGKKVKFWGLAGEVIGVVKDFHFRPLNTAIEPLIVRFRPKEFYFNLLIKIQPQQLAQTVDAVEKLYKKLDPIHPIAYGFVNQDVEAQYQSQHRTGRIVLYFAVLAIFIACLGLFGLATFTAEIRTKEIGIRKVLGASVASLTALLSKDFLKLVAVAIVVASPIAYYFMEKWLENFAYRIEISWWVFAFAGISAISIAFLTVGYRAVEAALMNPAKSLKTE